MYQSHDFKFCTFNCNFEYKSSYCLVVKAKNWIITLNRILDLQDILVLRNGLEQFIHMYVFYKGFAVCKMCTATNREVNIQNT